MDESVNSGITHASKWHAKDKATMRHRIVLRYLGKGLMMPFVIHTQIEMNDGSRYFEQGDYFNSMVDAETRFIDRAVLFETRYSRFLE